MDSDEQPVEAEVISKRPVLQVYSTPRRFDIALVLVVTVAYALLLSLMRVLKFEPLFMVAITSFFTIVGLGQAVLFRGKKPRLASVVAGAVGAGGICVASYWADGGRLDGLFYVFFFITMICYVPWGALLGYVVGTMIGGVFLIAEALRRKFGSRTVGEP